MSSCDDILYATQEQRMADEQKIQLEYGTARALLSLARNAAIAEADYEVIKKAEKVFFEYGMGPAGMLVLDETQETLGLLHLLVTFEHRLSEAGYANRAKPVTRAQFDAILQQARENNAPLFLWNKDGLGFKVVATELLQATVIYFRLENTEPEKKPE
jgi:sulfur relay (sulfurtransferase) DsrC/TusE family protein